MAFDEFSPFGVWSFSADDSVCKKTHDSLRDSLGSAFQQPNMDAIVYGDAMCLGAAQHQLDGAAAQRYPLQCTALIDALETEYQIVPAYGASLNTRQLELLAADTLQAGATETAIEAGLTAILGADFLGWRGLDPDNEVMIAAGDNSGVEWEIVQAELNAAAFEADAFVTAVAHNPDRNIWVALTQNAATSSLGYSTDSGRTWTNLDLTALPSKQWQDTCWANVAGTNQFVAVCATSGGDIESVATHIAGNGTWTAVEAVEGLWRRVKYAYGIVVAVGVNCAMYSLDAGNTWQPGTIPTNPFPSIQWTALATGNGIWVAGASLGQVATSTDGITFTSAATGKGAITDIVFGNGVFVMICSSGANSLKWSTDGVTWTNCTAGAYDPTGYRLMFCDGLFVVIDDFNLFTSTDGKTFSARPFYRNTGTLMPNNNLRGMASSANRIVITGQPLYVGDPGVAMTMRVLPVTKCSPPATTIKHVTLSGVIMPGSRTVSYSEILTNGDPIKTGEYLTVEPGRLGWQERVLVTASTSTTFTATFRYPHSDGVRATTAPWPTWMSTQRHSIVFVTPTARVNRTKLAKVQWYMRKVMPASSTWTVIENSYSPATGYTDPIKVGSGGIGYSTIGGLLAQGH